MKITAWNSLTSVRKHHLIWSLRKMYHPELFAQNRTCSWKVIFQVYMINESSSWSQRRIRGCQWHCWFLCWWCSGQIWLCHWSLREPVCREWWRNTQKQLYNTVTGSGIICETKATRARSLGIHLRFLDIKINLTLTWGYLRTAPHCVGILDSVTEPVALWQNTPASDDRWSTACLQWRYIITKSYIWSIPVDV